LKYLPSNKPLRVLLALVALLFCSAGALMANADSAVGNAPAGPRLEQISTSKNFRDGHFFNALPAIEGPYFEMVKRFATSGEDAVPKEPILILERHKSDFDELPSSGLRITWLGHSTNLVEIDGQRILLDPVWAERTSPFTWAGPKRFFEVPIKLDELPPIDAVLISHDHYDHLDQMTVEYLAKKGVLFIVPLGVGARLEAWAVKTEQIKEVDWWQKTKVGDIEISATPARHFSGRSIVMTDRDATLWAGFAMIGPTHRVYYSGDTGMFPGFKEIGERLGPFDAALIEVGAYDSLWADVHLGPEQAVQAFQDVKGGLLLPVHWGTFNLAIHNWTEPVERLMAAATTTDIAMVIPRPGQSTAPSNPPELVKWWPDVPWETAAESPVVSSGLAHNH